ncbi:MAG: hypothetical protein FWB85_08385 [Chitinispirillia bacterium]|nr:hypothetical protein [Chitinispirillia bacterium]MCL2241738.1 hypothetical protein [Chitinispirillia bacterium]
MVTEYDRLITNNPNPEVREQAKKYHREFIISELGMLREFRRLGYRPTLLPTEEDIRNDVQMPVDTKSEERKKMHVENRVERWMRDPKKMMRHMGDIVNMPTEYIEEVLRAESDEVYKINYAKWREQCA